MKSKHFKKLGTTAMVLLITACFIPAIAGASAPGAGRPGKGFGRQDHRRPALGIWRDSQMLQRLELTEKQVKQIRDADFIFREKHLALKSKLDGFRLKMDKAFSDDVVNDTTVLKMAKKIADVKGELFVQKIEGRLALRKILNADQIEKLKLCNMHQKRKGLRRGGNRLYGRHAVEMPGDRKHCENREAFR